jgi:hypothetical protein
MNYRQCDAEATLPGRLPQLFRVSDGVLSTGITHHQQQQLLPLRLNRNAILADSAWAIISAHAFQTRRSMPDPE